MLAMLGIAVTQVVTYAPFEANLVGKKQKMHSDEMVPVFVHNRKNQKVPLLNSVAGSKFFPTRLTSKGYDQIPYKIFY